MRKFLGYFCYIVSLALQGTAAYFSYRSYDMRISYQLGFLAFMPLFIASYWFSTFFSQLLDGNDKNGKPRIGKPRIGNGLYRVLSVLNTVISLALLIFWVYMFISRSLYQTDTGEITMLP